MAGDLIECRSQNYMRHDGFSATITASFAMGTAKQAISWDGSNMMSLHAITGDLTWYKHSGFSDSITSSFIESNSDYYSLCATWDGSNLLGLVLSRHDIIKYSGFSSSVVDSFSADEQSPFTRNWYGLTWDRTNVVVGRMTGSRRFVLQRHHGFSKWVKDYVIFNNYGYYPIITSISFDGLDYFFNLNDTNDHHARTLGYSSTIRDSFLQSIGSSDRIDWTGRFSSWAPGTTTTATTTTTLITTTTLAPPTSENLITTDIGTDKHYKHTGFSSTVEDSYVFSNPYGVCFNEERLIASADEEYQVNWLPSEFLPYIIDGFDPGFTPYALACMADQFLIAVRTKGETESYESAVFYLYDQETRNLVGTVGGLPDRRGAAWDGTCMLSCGFDDLHSRHWGFSGTINQSYVTPYDPGHIDWDGANVIATSDTTNKIYKHSGFSSSILTSFNSPSSQPMGLTWAAAMRAREGVWTSPVSVHSCCGYDLNFPCTNLVDDNTSTSWKHFFGEQHWVVVDMGSEVPMTRARIFGGGTGVYAEARWDDVSIAISSTPGYFPEPVSSGWNIGEVADEWYERNFAEETGRYVKFTIGSTGHNYNCLEGKELKMCVVTTTTTTTTSTSTSSSSSTSSSTSTSMTGTTTSISTSTSSSTSTSRTVTTTTLAPGVLVFVNDVDLTCYFDLSSIRIIEGFAARGSSASATITVPWADLHAELLEKPRTGQKLQIFVNYEREFEGPIATVQDELVNPDTFSAIVEAVDYTLRLDAHKVTKAAYPIQKAGERIKAILDEFCPQFAVDQSYIEDGELVPAEGYDEESPSAIFDELGEATDYHWYIDFDGAVHFFNREYIQSPLAGALYGNLLNLDTNLEIGGVTVVEDWSNLYNYVTIRDFSQRSSYKYTHTEVADGQQSFFKLPMPPWALEDTTVKVSGNSRVVAVDPLDGSPGSIEGAPDQAYLCIFNWGVRFPEVDLPGDGDLLEFTYDYEIPNCKLSASNELSISEVKRREGGLSDGIHETAVSLPNLRAESTALVYQYIQTLLSRHAWPMIRGSFGTYMQGWGAGQRFRVTSDKRDIYNIRRWVETGRGTKYPVVVWVQQVTKRVVSVHEADSPEAMLYYEVEFASRPFAE